MMIAVLPNQTKQVYRRLCARQIKFRKLIGYYGWRLQTFDIPEEAKPIIMDLIIQEPEALAGCDWLGRPIDYQI